MKSETPNGTCVHPPCSCAVDTGQLYCSDACRDAHRESACACGHAGCTAVIEKSPAA